MALSDHVSLTISQDSLGVARAGFGVPLILSANAAFPERIRFYNDLAGITDDGFTTDSPEYLAARAMLSQQPHPERIAIGRAANKPTQVYTLSVATVRNSHTYEIEVKGEGVTATTASYTSDASATDGEIVVGLVAALNAVVGNNYIAAGATSPFTVTGDAAGEWFSLKVNAADLEIAQTHADPGGGGVAADLAAISLENDDWYMLCTLYNSEDYVIAAADYIEAVKKMYIPDVNETDAITTAAGNGDTLDELATANYARTAGMYHQEPAEMAAAAWMGRVLPLEPGSETWKFKTLAGLDPTSLTTTQRTNLVNRSANFYQTVAGVAITQEGTTSDGDFIDVQRFIDWLEDDMSKAVFEALAGADKVPYTDAGVAIIEAEVRGSLRRGINRGGLAEDPAPVVTVPLVADVATADKALRLLPDVKFSATLAGAVHKVTITGVVSV
jgi:hypothetical protein